jgi:hypothetical protein
MAAGDAEHFMGDLMDSANTEHPVPNRVGNNKCASTEARGVGALADNEKSNLQQQPANSTPWTARDIRRLKQGLRTGTSIPHLAVQLKREIGDVRAKVDELTRHYVAERASRIAVGPPRCKRT